MPFWIPLLIGAGIAGVAFAGGAAVGYYYARPPMYRYPVQYYAPPPYYGMQFYPAYY